MFKKKPKSPLTQAARLVYDAIEIAYRYKRDKAYMPTPDDLKLFSELDHALWECHCSASYISHCMNQRAAGQKEGALKYSDPVVFDYHYPEGS